MYLGSRVEIRENRKNRALRVNLVLGVRKIMKILVYPILAKENKLCG